MSAWQAEETTDCWCDEPLPGDRRSWAVPDDPPETWQAVQRLAGLGYDWHNVMHMIMELVSEDFYRVMAEKRQFDRADYIRRLNALPGDWPPPEELGLR